MDAMTKSPKDTLNAMVIGNAMLVEVVSVNDARLVVGHGMLCKLL